MGKDKNRQKRMQLKRARRAKRRKEALRSRSPQTKTKNYETQKEREDPTELSVEMLMKGSIHWPEKMLMSVGAELHKSRKVRPLLEEEAPEGSTYDDRVGITFGPLSVETCGFQISGNPRRIGVREVAKYANKSCKRCYGRGYQKIQRTQEATKDEFGRKVMQDNEYEQSCGCADENYKKQHPLILIDSQFGEWIAIDDLSITEGLQLSVEGVSDGVPEVQQGTVDDELQREAGVSELSGTG